MCSHSEATYHMHAEGHTIVGYSYACPCGISGAGKSTQEAHEAFRNRAVREAAISRWKRGEPPKDNTERRVLALSIFAPSCHHKH